MTKWLFALAVLQACTVGAAGRVEAMYEGRGSHVAASAVPAFGATKIDGTTGDVAHEKGTFALLGVGVGWISTGHPFVEVSLQSVAIPGADGGAGFVAGLRTRIGGGCVRWSVDAGATALVRQLRAENRVDEFGPNPRVTRVYHDVTALAGYTSCRDGTRFGGHVGLAYELGVAELLFAPGP